MTTPYSRSTLLHQRGSALANCLKRQFETTKLLRAQFREYLPHLPGMLSEGGNNQVLAPQAEGDNPNAPVFGALDPADQALRGPIVLTGKGPLCSSTSSTPKSERPSPVSSIPAAAYRVRARMAFIITSQTWSVP
jgi:hypothetical protein